MILKDVLNQRGRLIKKEYHHVGEIRDNKRQTLLVFNTFALEVIAMTEDTTEHYYGVQIEYFVDDRAWSNHFLYDELKDLIAALVWLNREALVMEGKRPDQMEFIYSSGEGHRFGMVQTNDTQTWFILFDTPDVQIVVQQSTIGEIMQLFRRANEYLANIAA